MLEEIITDISVYPYYECSSYLLILLNFKHFSSVSTESYAK
jgi:hypothetical protein